MRGEQARQQAQAEGLTLLRADNKAGYFGVQLNKPGQPKPYLAQLRSGGKSVCLGSFATAEEAALCVARSPEGREAAKKAAKKAAAAMPPDAQPTDLLRLLAQAGGAGGTATSRTESGRYRYVTQRPNLRWQGRVRGGGGGAYIGQFATQAEAAWATEHHPAVLQKAAELASAAVAMPDHVAKEAADALGVPLEQKADMQGWDNYKGTMLRRDAGAKRWQAVAGGTSLGYYMRSTEAALHYAYYTKFGVQLRHVYEYTSGGALPCRPLATPQNVASSSRGLVGGGRRLGGDREAPVSQQRPQQPQMQRPAGGLVGGGRRLGGDREAPVSQQRPQQPQMRRFAGGPPPALTGDGSRKRPMRVADSDDDDEEDDFIDDDELLLP